MKRNSTLSRDGTLKHDGTFRRDMANTGTMTRVVDDFTPSYEPADVKKKKKPSSSSSSAKKAPFSGKPQHTPTYIDDVDDEFDYLY